MRYIFFAAFVFICVVLPANASEHQIFYTAGVEGRGTVNLNLVSSDVARDRDFDVDVVITMVEKDASGNSVYIDWSRHQASIRCRTPVVVKVRESQYKIDSTLSAGIDWKHDLWEAVCMAPMS